MPERTAVRVPYAYLERQFGDAVEEYVGALRDWIPTGEYTLGPYVDSFERQFAEYVGAKHAVGTNTGTGALILGLKALGVGPGDEVISQSNSFIATAGAIVAVGARPVFVDVDERYQMNIDLIEQAITERTKAILPVHWAGGSPDIHRIVEIGDRYGIPVIEDACPSVGALVDGRKAGTFGRIGCFSMHPLKPLNVMGDGGVIVTDVDEMDSWLRLYRNHGLADRDHVTAWGVNERLQPFAAIVGSRVLAGIEEIVGLRNRNARALDDALAPLRDHIRTPERIPGHREAFQLYLASAERRDELVRFLHAHGVEAKVHYPVPIHLQEAARNLGYERGSLPVTERQAREVLTIPSHQHLELEQIEYAVDRIRAFYAR